MVEIPRGETTQKIAEKAGVGSTIIKRIRSVDKDGTPELHDAVSETFLLKILFSMLSKPN